MAKSLQTGNIFPNPEIDASDLGGLLANGSVGDVLTQTGVGTVAMQAPMQKLLAPIILSSFAWINQGLSTVSQAGRGTLLTAEKASVASRVSIRSLEKLLAANTSYTICASVLSGATNAGLCGIVFHNPTTHAMYTFSIRSGASLSISGETYSSDGIDEASVPTTFGYVPGSRTVYMQVRVYDNAGLYDMQICVSHDGYNYIPLSVVSGIDPADFSHVGIYASSVSNVTDTVATFWGYEEAPCTGPLS